MKYLFLIKVKYSKIMNLHFKSQDLQYKKMTFKAAWNSSVGSAINSIIYICVYWLYSPH